MICPSIGVCEEDLQEKGKKRIDGRQTYRVHRALRKEESTE